jgi:hypothetical protein
MWTSRKVHSFLSMLAVQLNRMEDSASLRDAWDACVFFAASMGRLGADFTAQLPPLFENKMHALVEQCWKEGVNQLAETLKICREAGVASPLTSTSHTVPEERSPMTTTLGTTDGGPLPPPRQLMGLPPLARLVNAFVAGLNELRRCLLPGIFSRLRASMDEILKQVTGILQTNERAVMTPGLRGDAAQLRQIAAEMKQALADIVDPYVRGALEYALGNEETGAEFHKKLIEKEKEQEKEAIAEEEETGEGDADPENVVEEEVTAAAAQEDETDKPSPEEEVTANDTTEVWQDEL